MTKKKKLLCEKIKNMKNESLREILENIKSCKGKFDESIDINIKLGINPRKSEENVRGSAILPFGIKKNIKVLVFAVNEKAEEAKNAGADVVGFEDIIESIKVNGMMECDICFVTTDLLPKLGQIAKILGKSGRMPNKKDGTVTDDLSSAIKEVKEGKKVVFRNDDAGHIHARIGKSSFDTDQLIANFNEFRNSLFEYKPAKVKDFFKTIHLSSTQGIGISVPLSYK
jgi:large subunit ribosomal protein L1